MQVVSNFTEEDEYDIPNVSYAIVGHNNRTAKATAMHHKPCHGSIRWTGMSKPKAVLSWIRDFHPLTFTWTHWLRTESPWSSPIANRSTRDAIDNGLIVDGLYPANYVAQTLQASRQCWEFPHIIEMWNRLRKRGVEPILALVVSHYLLEYNNGSFKWGDRNNEHGLFDTRKLTYGLLHNLRTGSISHPNPLYTENPEYSQTFNTWADDHDTPMLLDYTSLPLPDTHTYEGWNGKNEIGIIKRKKAEDVLFSECKRIEAEYNSLY